MTTKGRAYTQARGGCELLRHCQIIKNALAFRRERDSRRVCVGRAVWRAHYGLAMG